MKAVIPAAGLGTRFLPLTKEQPKEMLPVVDRPAIHWVVAEALAAGATDILLITGREKRAVEDYFDHSAHWEQHLGNGENAMVFKEIDAITSRADLHYVRQREPKGLGDAILHAEKHVGDEPFLVILGDTINVGDPPVARQLWGAYDRVRHSILAVEHVRPEKISDYGIVKPGRAVDERIVLIEDLVEKPASKDAPSDLGISGTYVLTPSIFDAIRRTTPGRGGELQLTDALRVLMTSEPVYAYQFIGRRFDIGTKLDWFRAHVELTLEEAEFRDAARTFLKELIRNG